MSEGRNIRVLRRRVVLGTIAAVLLFAGLWQAWDLDWRVFWELLGGAVALVLALALAGAVTAALIRLLRRLLGGR